jgi:hypothetical protein
VPISVRVVLMVKKVALVQCYLRVLRFSPVDVIPPLFHICSSSGGETKGPLTGPFPQIHSILIATIPEPISKRRNTFAV